MKRLLISLIFLLLLLGAFTIGWLVKDSSRKPEPDGFSEDKINLTGYMDGGLLVVSEPTDLMGIPLKIKDSLSFETEASLCQYDAATFGSVACVPYSISNYLMDMGIVTDPDLIIAEFSKAEVIKEYKRRFPKAEAYIAAGRGFQFIHPVTEIFNRLYNLNLKVRYISKDLFLILLIQ